MTANQLANPREAQARAPKALDKRRETWRETHSPLWLVLKERIISLAQELGGAGMFLCHFLKSKLSGMPPSTERVIKSTYVTNYHTYKFLRIGVIRV